MRDKQFQELLQGVREGAEYLRDERMSGAIRYQNISSDPDICGGVPCVIGTRIPVQTIGAYAQSGLAALEIVEEHFPWLTTEEVSSALAWLQQVEKLDTSHLDPISDEEQTELETLLDSMTPEEIEIGFVHEVVM